MTMDMLTNLHREIGKCKRCSLFTEVKKNPSLERGSAADVMIIGVSPGKTEIIKEKAFSGAGGKKLFTWLKEADLGSNEQVIRNKVYFTSLIKCFPSENYFDNMFSHCYSFLVDQLSLVAPKILITLGIDPFNRLFNLSNELGDIVGRRFEKGALVIPSFFEDDVFTSVIYIIPFPHPSGLSRWLNHSQNQVKLNDAINVLKKTTRELENEK